MSISQSLVLDIKHWLSNQHIIVPNEWVEACLEFLREFHDLNMIQQLKKCVYDQWLNVDLEEIGIGTLPSNVCSTQKVVLSGIYALQINGMRDISKPAYSQLRQLEGTSNADVEVSAAPKVAQPEWEAKPSRVLLLNLTDGVNFVQAMEYKPISILSLNLPPGTKILIKGPVDCSLGIILLTQDKLKILGGEVENLLQKYSQQVLLREALQLSPNSEDNVEQDESATLEVDHNVPDSNDSNLTLPQQISLNNQRNRNFPTGRNSVLPMQNQTSRLRTPHSNNENEDFDDVFPDDIDYDALAEMERLSSLEQQDQPSSAEANISNSSEVNEDEEMLQQAYEDMNNVDPFEENYMNNPLFSGPESPKHKEPQNTFTYINVIKKNGIPSTECSFTIKGFIGGILSRLQCTQNKEWQLAAKISDNTGSLDADFHNKVLEKFVGISAEDTIKMQLQARENVEVRNRIMSAIANCKAKLRELNCLMEVQFKPGQRPCIVKCL